MSRKMGPLADSTDNSRRVNQISQPFIDQSTPIQLKLGWILGYRVAAYQNSWYRDQITAPSPGGFPYPGGPKI